ncbi:MAG: UPF0175 family protein [Dehalococcoidia bacterium]
MTTLSFELPDDVVGTVAATPAEFERKLRLTAAMAWYGRSEVSLGTAAQIAGMNIRDFLFALSRHKQDIFAVDWDDFERELALLGERRRDSSGG